MTKNSVALIIFLLLLFVGILAGDRFRTVSGFDQSQMLAARSILNSGSLSAPEFYQIDAQLRELSLGAGAQQDYFAETVDGKLVPKHSVVLPYILAPLLPLLGDRAPLGLSILVLWLLFVAVVRATGEIESLSIKVSVVLLFVFSQFIFYVGSIPYDTLSALCTIVAFSQVKRRPFYGGACLMLGVFVRPTIVLFAPFLLLLVLLEHHKIFSRMVGCFLGMVVPLTLYGLMNWYLFGSFLVTAYHRLPEYFNGTLMHAHHPIGFSLSVFFSRWYDKLLDPTYGVLRYNSFLLLLPFAARYIASHRERMTLTIYSAAGLGYSLYIFSYEMWYSTYFGNRFLMPSLVLMLVPIAAFVSAFVKKSRAEYQKGSLNQSE
jgi:hypothetical protein